MKIALDAMGGDHAPQNPVAGAVQALRDFPDVEIIFVGDEQKVRAELAKHSTADIQTRFSFHHASQVVDMTDSGLDSVRRKKDSSVSRAVELQINSRIVEAMKPLHEKLSSRHTTPA